MLTKQHKTILQNAEKLRELYENINRTLDAMPARVRSGPHHLRSEEWRNACEVFHKAWGPMSFPGGSERIYRLKNFDDPSIIDSAITFLEADPMFFRSGYLKEDILRALKKCKLSKKDIQRLHAVILMMVDKCNRREFRYYCKLARVIISPELEKQLQNRLSSQDNDIRKRANWVLEAVSAN